MRLSSGFRAALMALFVAFAGVSLSSAARADGGTISFRVIKGGWIIGASGGSGVLVFHGHRYPISIGGLSAGFVFGASATHFRGTVNHILSPYDVAAFTARRAPARRWASAAKRSCCATRKAPCSGFWATRSDCRSTSTSAD